jgi:hypothetical protein
MPDVSVPWGDDNLTLALPDDWTLQQVASPTLKPAGDDWPDRLGRALSGGPEGLARLLAARRDGRIAIIVEDLTRHSPLEQILPLVLREIEHARIDRDQVEIVFATGMHPPMNPEEVAAKIGPLAGEIRWRCNPWAQRGSHVRIGAAEGVEFWLDRGVAEADLRIIVSSVSPHLQAGFGGGYKMLFPGCAALETIRSLHRKGLGRRSGQLVGTDETSNPMRRAIDAGGELVEKHHGRSFAIQYLLDDHDKPTTIAAGEVLPTWRMTAKQCSVACGVPAGRAADVLITNAWPRDHDLWQSFKAIANTRHAVRPNGAIICLSRCEAGLGGMNPPKWPISPSVIRRVLRWVGPESLASLVMRLVPRLAGDAAFFIRLAMQVIQRNPIFMVSPGLHERGEKFPGLDIFGTLDEAVAAAKAQVGEGPQRVVVFPSGGITFPLPDGPARSG